ncbi:efflux RND transporter permease subunit [Fontivita pretiosa]|uniref:efflux RND transporter permease subunit n=1 Tax=Fontivita pretiosa TaxID=2989684 RepID=UPI003D17D644
MSFVERCIRQPVAVAVVVLLVVIFGMIGLLRVPVQLTPNVDQPVISVTTRWFGASPQEIEQEILQEQEEVLKTLSGLRQMTSEAFEGEGSVRLEFFVGVDKQAALNEVRDKLSQVPEYPPQVDRPNIESVDSSSRDWIAWMLVRPLNNDPANVKPGPGFNGDVTELQTFLEDFVKPELERGEGVESVQVLGGREREMQVRVDMQKLAARGISVDQFVEALRQENLNVSAGAIPLGKRDISIRAMGQYDDPEQIRNTVVGWTAAGAPVYVRDVADVGIGFKRQVSFVRSEGQDVMALNAKRETGTNVLTVMQNLKRQIEKVNREILGPKGWCLELNQVYDQTVYVDRAVTQAADDLLLGAALAAVVLFLTLRSVGATLVVCISIPISVIGTFLGMALTGRNLNVISMAGLSFAIGMGVDNTIVVLENIFRHREMGKDRLRAAIDGAQEVWGAIVAATLANIAVFLPVVFIREEAGQLFKDISIAISISLLLYMAVSPTVIPVLATLFLRKMPGGFVEKGEQVSEEPTQTLLGRLTRPISRAGARLSHAFYALVLWLTHGLVRRVVLVVAMIGAAVVASALLIPPRTYLPSGNQNLIFAFVLTPPGYAVEEYRQMAYHVERALRPWWEAKPGSDQLKQLQDAWKQARDQVMVPMMQQQLAGMEQMLAAQNKPPQEIAAATAQTRKELERLRNSPPPAGIDNFFFVVFQGMVFMGATSNDPENVGSLAYLFQQATQGIPGTFGVAQQATIFDLGDSFGTTVDVNLSGEQIETVRSAAAIVQGMIMGNLGTFPVPNPQNFALGRQETRVLPDRIRAASAGITTSTIRRATQIAVDGEVIGDYREGAKSIDLTIMAQRPADRGVEALRDLPLAGRSGWVMPLSQVADFVQTDAPQRIRRIEELPAVTLSVPVQQNQTVQQVEDSIWQGVIEPARQQGLIPPEINIRTSGSAAKLSQFMRAFIPGFVLAAVITYLLLAALFESWLHPFVIIMSVPFALVGGFLGLRLMHEYQPDIQLDVLTMLGFVILIGTIVNNPILIVHQALNYLREGLDRQHAIALSTQTRVRPIFMSVITSVAGMAPLVLLGGAGSELYRGLGAVVIGGLLLSTVFTLFLTPTLMSLALDAQAGIRHLLHRQGSAHARRGGAGVQDLREAPASAHKAAPTEPVLSRSPSVEQG